MSEDDDDYAPIPTTVEGVREAEAWQEAHPMSEEERKKMRADYIPTIQDLEIAEGRVENAKQRRWLNAIKETFRAWWTDERSQWDGSLCGLPNELENVARHFRQIEVRHAHLMTVARLIDDLDMCEGYTLPDSELPKLWKALSMARKIVKSEEDSTP